MGLFKKKGNFVANVTRAALGQDYVFYKFHDERFRGVNDEGVNIQDVKDWRLTGLPEASAVMIIYGYCRLKYQDPKLGNDEVIKQVILDRTLSRKTADWIVSVSFGSVFSAINSSLLKANAAYTFTDNELVIFYENLCKKSPIFSGLDIG